MNRLLMLAALTACGGTADADGDGFTVERDCDDDDKSIHPKAPDLFGDGVDSNCDGVDGVDADGDGAASIDSGGVDCDDNDPDYLGANLDHDEYSECIDCDDTNPTVNPNAQDPCNGDDDDCDGRVDVGPDGVGTCVVELQAHRRVDVLMVVDTSCSMFEEQTSLAASAPILIDAFLLEGLDFHIGVISTDVPADDGRLTEDSGVRSIDAQTPSPHEVASNMIQLGTAGSWDERGLDTAYKALGERTLPGGHNEGFVRPDADLSIIVLSDEDDKSWISPSEFSDWLIGFKPGPRAVAFHSVVSPVPLCTSAAEPGAIYLGVTEQVGGFTQSICDEDYATIIQSIALEHTSANTQFFLLPYAVDPTTLAATMTTEAGAVSEFAADELTWDAPTLTVGLPVNAPSGSSVVFWFAPVNQEPSSQ